jgi:AhpD family alkylhydroperoxidase
MTDSHASSHDHGEQQRHGTDVMRSLAPIAAELRREIPDVLEGYKALATAAMAPGAVDAKTKELIALAIAVTKQCDGCIAAHARSAAKKGATRAEVAEAMGVAIMMNGGPGTVYGPRALAAYDDFAAVNPPTS